MVERGPVLVVGESLVDVVERDGSRRELPGGSAANAAVALARLGERTLLATALGPDARGGMLRAHLEGAGVGWASEPVCLEETSVAEARIGADGQAEYAFRISWRLHPAAPGLPRPAVVLLSSLAPVLDPGAEAVARLLDGPAHGRPLVYDVNARPQITGTGERVVAAVEATAARAALVKASDEDLAALWPGRSEDAAVDRLLALGAGAVVVTRGPDGASWYDAGRTLDQPAVTAPVVDTIGAGDTFGAALVSSLLRAGCFTAPLAAASDADVHGGLARGAAAAAVVVSRPGADPPTAQELESASESGPGAG